jgi:hypothetical protein
MGGSPSKDTIRNAAITRLTGSGLNSANPIERDLSTLPLDALKAKYGPDTVSQLIAATDLYNTQNTAQRSWGQIAKDTAIGAGHGIIAGADALPWAVGASPCILCEASAAVQQLRDQRVDRGGNPGVH